MTPLLPDSYFEPYLNEIATSIHARKNRVREAMNNALIAIGVRDDNLQDKALEVAKVRSPEYFRVSAANPIRI